MWVTIPGRRAHLEEGSGVGVDAERLVTVAQPAHLAQRLPLVLIRRVAVLDLRQDTLRTEKGHGSEGARELTVTP